MLQQIGLGALGPVFRAYDPNGDRLVAVKVYQVELDHDRVTRLVHELRELIERHRPHKAVPTPIATGLADGSAYLVQTFVPATSVDVVLRQHGPMPTDRVLRMAAQLADALAAGCERETHHGALHLRDVLVAADDTWITGLGVSSALERVGVRVPTHEPYAAPERRAHEGRWDHRADLFSLAAIVAELITGVPVSEGGEVDLASRPDIAGSRRAALDRAFAHALAPRPEDRVLTASAFVKELQHALGTQADPAETAVDDVLIIRPPSDGSRYREGEGRAASLHAAHAPLPSAVAPGDMLLRSSVSAADEESLDLTLPLPLSERNALASFADEPASREVPLPVEPAEPSSGEATVLLNDASSTPRVTDLVLTPEVPESPASHFDDVRTSPLPVGEGIAGRPIISVPSTSASRSALWPLSLALVVGLVVGAAVGFIGFITRTASSAEEAPVALTSPAPSQRAPAGLAADMSSASGTRSPLSTAPLAESAPVVAPPAEAPSAVPPTAATPTSRAIDVPRSRSQDRQAAQDRPVGTTDRSPRDGRAEAAGRVLVRSLPAGARVLLDGQDMGSTPVPLRAIPFGGHTLRIVHDGYLAAERRLTLTPEQPAQSLIVDLVQARGAPPAATTDHAAGPTAGLIVESRPAGATVFLNDRRLGTTPLTMEAVATGVHAIRLELEGYRRWSSSVRVAAGERNRVAASLEH